MTITLSALQKQRTDTAANWTSANPTLLSGELGFESDTGKVKLGTGSTAWNSLGYLGVIPASGAYPLSQLLLPSGTAAAPSLTFAGDLNTGIYRPGADQVAISTNGTGRLFIDASGNVGIGTASPVTQFHIQKAVGGLAGVQISTSTHGSTLTDGLFVGIDNSLGYLYNYENLPLVFGTNATERLRITSAGLVGIGTSSVSTKLEIAGNNDAVTENNTLRFTDTDVSTEANQQIGKIEFYSSDASTPGAGVKAYIGAFAADTTPDAYLAFATQDGSVVSTPVERVRITSDGKVGIGTTDPGAAGASAYRDLVIAGTGNRGITIQCGSGNVAGTVFNTSNGGNAGGYIYNSANAQMLVSAGGGTGNIAFNTNSAERARIDSSGRLLVGTSSSSANTRLVVQGNTAGGTYQAAVVDCRINGANPPANYTIGEINFRDNADARGALIKSESDGDWATNDYPGRLVFSTTADGASSPTERMRILNNGTVLIGKTADNNNAGFKADVNSTYMVADAQTPVFVNRNTNDGTLIEFRQDGTGEGTISVSGTTVSYNGAHLSRWSQLPSGAGRTEILRGTVLSNIDEMCEWGDEDNEQLNRMKVSDVEGDKNVSGVFQAWDDDDDTYTNDFYCAMTGDFVIRIAAGVTVERGDLLMSAGNGTAKPQEDDIIRSKTIAKVTSTTVSCTHPDGSYCVPCVLMAC